MIKATELRIGNHVIFHGDEDMISQLDAADIKNIANEVMDNHKIHSPIPLTTQLLDKQHFIKRGITYQFGKYILWWTGNSDSEYSFMLFDERDDDKPGKAIGSNYSPFTVYSIGLRCINNVHELQNLYFFLTGEELHLKL